MLLPSVPANPPPYTILMPDTYISVVVVLLLTYLILRIRSQNLDSSIPLPPGPKPKTFIGNLCDAPQKREWETYTEWAEKYGPIVHVRTWGQSTIVLNTYKAVSDLLESRSSRYSNRPHLVMLRDLMGERGTAMAPYGDTWKKHRRLYNQHLNPGTSKSHYPLQIAAAQKLLKQILASPEKYVAHIKHVAGSVVTRISYGDELSWDKFEEYVSLSDQNSVVFLKAMRPGEYLVDTIPILKYLPSWMPGGGFQKMASQVRKNLEASLEGPFSEVKRHFLAGSRSPSVVIGELSKLGTADEREEGVQLVKEVAASIAEAGSGTTTSTILWCILAMTLYPEVQEKAHQELDYVLGPDRLPSFDDRPQLPYVEAIVKEVHRWMPIAVMGVPHYTTTEDIYEGYRIPANSIVIGNNWSIMHDSEMYPDPWSFKPERFLPEDPKDMPLDPRIAGSFGWGRRICPGRHFADATVWILIASLLSAFKFSKAVDKDGNEIDVEYAKELPDTLVLSCPKDFPCSIIPRSKDSDLLIKQLEPNW